jgi:hypothetical protein
MPERDLHCAGWRPDAVCAVNVKELIKALRDMPGNAEVRHIWDGGARTAIAHVWLAKGGYVCTADSDEVVYYDADRPSDAPLETVNPYWSTPDK